MIRLVQLKHPKHGRQAALVDGDTLQILKGIRSLYRLAQLVTIQGGTLEDAVAVHGTTEALDYNRVHRGDSDWQFLPAFDHPDEPARCLVTGTGLTHKSSAENRQAMHAPANGASMSDSMRMYQSGLEGGRPEPGQIGAAPEWFYKGSGVILRAHGQSLDVPCFGRDGGEEAEVAGIYLIDDSGNPRRVGMAVANEFSDHQLEQESYLYLAPSKLRTCAIGPELLVNADFADARGAVKIFRGNDLLWSKPFATGEKNMSHTVANLEHHHFKYDAHRRPGDVHIHFFGADVFSFGDRIHLQDGDVMEIELGGFGRALRNPVHVDQTAEKLRSVIPL
jgi:hypothetical protein